MDGGSYVGALQVAREAAAEAAALLLAECRRPDGPRGSHGHCPADDEAERLIRARLTGAFPDWGYRGEETGYAAPANGEQHLWLVDPNDGTSAMHGGYRGHAVSIALLRDGVPVLGVVRAVDAPDDEGEEFAWAEGCGPLLRNGKPLPAPNWPAQLGAYDIVFVSQAAERHPSENIRLVVPGRFRSVASIAYRLALVAAGDGVAGVSLSGPGGWDYAAGHALLRAVGGALLDQDGRPVTYGRDGVSHTRCCFGGQPEIVASLASHRWNAAIGRGDGQAASPAEYRSVKLAPRELCHDTALLRRAQGCMLGQVAGDSLGALVEFQTRDEIERRYADGPRLLANGGTHHTLAGQPTDDSELALLLGRTLVRLGRYDADAVAAAYGRWFHGWLLDVQPGERQRHWSRPFDVGTTTEQALSPVGPEHLHGGAAAVTMGAASRGSQSNGALMRISPLGIWGWDKELAAVADAARQDARLTHPHLVCQECSAIYAVAIAHALATGSDPRATYTFARQWADANCRAAVVGQWLAEAERQAPADYLEQQGWVRIAFQNAFFQLLHAPSLEDGVVRTVRQGATRTRTPLSRAPCWAPSLGDSTSQASGGSWCSVVDRRRNIRLPAIPVRPRSGRPMPSSWSKDSSLAPAKPRRSPTASHRRGPTLVRRHS